MSSPTASETRCALHGSFDSVQGPGCPTCREAGETEPAGLPWGKIGAVLVALCVGWAFLGGDRAAQPESTAGPRMKIHLYRAQIQTLEDLLYAEGTQGESDLTSILAQTRQLAELMRESESRLSMIPLIGDITGYADFLTHLGESGFDAARVEDARREWERVRAQVFEEPASAGTATR